MNQPAHAVDLNPARAVLKEHWGYDAFRSAQEVVVAAALSGRDVLAVLPTGYGKSAAFQVPTILVPGTAIVVSPLIALMKDQVDDCDKRGISASFVNSHVDEDEVEVRLEALQGGAYKIFYVAPERMQSKNFRDALKATKVNFFVVDECHCASRWGHDFRPAYMRIVQMVKLCERKGVRPPILAVTATATRDVETDVVKALGLHEGYERIVGDPVRPNLSYEVINDGRNTLGSLSGLAREFDLKGGRYIIYASTRGNAEMYVKALTEPPDFKQPYELNGEGKKVWPKGDPIVHPNLIAHYHGGMDQRSRTDVQNAFKNGTKPVIIATNAFGMGIDVPNIRMVIHMGIPGSVEDYCQEAGRAGRDGKPSRVVLINDGYAENLRRYFLDNNNPPYECFERMWAFLHQFDEGAVITMTGKEFEEALSPMTSGQALGVLSNMDSHGLVDRTASSADTVALTINTAAIEQALADDVLSGNRKRLAETLLIKLGEGYEERASLEIGRLVLAAALKLSESAVMALLKKLAEDDYLDMAPAFRGKTTKVKKWEADLEVEIPREIVEAKRERELKRLERMLEYVDAPDKAEHIRAYFRVDRAQPE